MKHIIHLIVIFAITASAGAQQHPSPPFATLRGVVTDSVRGGHPRGAAVSLIGSAGLAFTDSLGRYRMDSIAPGEYEIVLFDHLLDTLGLTVVSRPLRFSAGDTVTFDISIPSSRAIIAAKCGPLQAAEVAVMGQVLDAVSGEPAEGARVTLGWTELAVGQQTGFRRDPKQRVAMTDAQGHYRFCGLPSGLTADAYAELRGSRTGYVALALGDTQLVTATFLIPSAPVAATAAPADSAVNRAAVSHVRGVVMDGSGNPVANAHVSVAEDGAATVTDSGGRFDLNARRFGTQALVVRRLGFLPRQVTVNLTPRASAQVTVRLDQHVPVLDEVRIAAVGDAGLNSVGYARRKRQGAGQYMGMEEIQRRNAVRLVDLFTGFRGLRVVGDEVRGQPEGSGYRCVRYFIDGQRWSSGSPADFVLPSEVAAIEVYSRSLTPGEFQTFGDCETIVVWTKWRLRR